MAWIWIVLGVLLALGGVRYRRRLRAGRSSRLDDAAVQDIIDTGSWSAGEDDDAPLDMDEAARAEEEFWEESWDEPEEYGA